MSNRISASWHIYSIISSRRTTSAKPKITGSYKNYRGHIDFLPLTKMLSNVLQQLYQFSKCMVYSES